MIAEEKRKQFERQPLRRGMLRRMEWCDCGSFVSGSAGFGYMPEGGTGLDRNFWPEWQRDCVQMEMALERFCA